MEGLCHYKHTNTAWGQVGKHLSGFPWGEGMCWGRTAPSPCPCGAFNMRSGASGLSKVRSSCSNRYSWLDEAQTLQLVKTCKTAKFDFVADWEHKSTFWVSFLAVKKYFKMHFFSPHLFQPLYCSTNKAEHPSHATWAS